MKYTRLLPCLCMFFCLSSLLLLIGVQPAVAAPWAKRLEFAHPAFAAQWTRTDAPEVRGDRAWYWGPTPWFDYYEFHRESPNGLHLVQYFDKARMEINNSADGAVSNGLLVVEMVSGNQRTGAAPGDTFDHEPAAIPVAGDPLATNPDAPMYSSFREVTTTNDPTSQRNPDRSSQLISATIDRGGQVGTRDDLAQTYAEQTRIAEYSDATGHNIPTIFWTFLNARGRTIINGQVRTGPIVDWLSVMGYPITEPYWIRTNVGGMPQDVLVQLFQRRVLTFTPANPEPFKVEMGNVGQHYFQWRYPHLGLPWAAPPPPLPIFFASNRSGNQLHIFHMTPEGDNQVQLLAGDSTESVPASIQRAYGGYDNTRVMFDSLQADGTYRQLYAVAFENGSDVLRLTYTDTTPPFSASPYPPVAKPSNESAPAISPDGTKLAFLSDRTGQRQLFLMGYQAVSVGTVGDQVQLTNEPCDHDSPSWSPDGRSMVWAANCDGDWEIYRGDLAYTQDSRTLAGRYTRNNLQVTLVNVTQLTNNAVDDRAPRISPDGVSIALQSNRNGSSHIYIMEPDGGTAQITQGSGNDETPSWSPDGVQLVFSSQRDGDWEVYRVNADGSGLLRLTTSPGDDRSPVWAQ